MSRRQRLRRWAPLLALAAVLAFSVPPSSQADDDWYPGLPPNDGTVADSWQAAAQGGISYANRAKQWFRTPDGMVTFGAAIDPDNSIEILPNGDRVDSYESFGRAVVVSPKGAPENYGYLPQMTVRSVGFGLMPVEATVQISQRRKDGYPVPFATTLAGKDYFRPVAGAGYEQYQQVSAATVVDDALNVQILRVRVDGVDLELNGDCRTATPAPVHMVGPAYTIPYPPGVPHARVQQDWFLSHDPSEFFSPFWGGQLSGTITIPPFVGCTTKSGDDLSALMTLSVSGPDNPVSARVGWPCVGEKEGTGWPLAPGEATPKLVPDWWHPTADAGTPLAQRKGCPGTQKAPYPQRVAD